MTPTTVTVNPLGTDRPQAWRDLWLNGRLVVPNTRTIGEPSMPVSAIRRGKTVVQWIFIAALLVLAVVAGVTLVGTRTSTKLSQTATDVANPQSLTTRFGS